MQPHVHVQAALAGLLPAVAQQHRAGVEHGGKHLQPGVGRHLRPGTQPLRPAERQEAAMAGSVLVWKQAYRIEQKSSGLGRIPAAPNATAQAWPAQPWRGSNGALAPRPGCPALPVRRQQAQQARQVGQRALKVVGSDVQRQDLDKRQWRWGRRGNRGCEGTVRFGTSCCPPPASAQHG